MLTLVGAAGAHDFWLKLSQREAVLHYGHGSEDEGYSPDKVKKALGVDAAGKETPVKLVPEGQRVRLVPAASTTQMGAEVDQGYWVKTTQGWKNQSKSETPNALLSEWSRSYTKVLLSPKDCLRKPLGQALELVALEWSPAALRLQVLYEGKPLSGVKIYANHKKVAESDSKGEAQIAAGTGLVLSAGYRTPLQGNPHADRLNLRAVLTLP